MYESTLNFKKDSQPTFHSINNVRKLPLERGVTKKYEIEGKLETTNRTRNISLVERTFFNPNEMKEWIDNWRMLKDAGLPVPSTLRVTDEKTVLMGNMRSHGEETYGKGFACELMDNIRDHESKGIPLIPIKEVDRKFLETYSTQKSEFLAEVQRLEMMATAQNIVLPYDDAFELLVRPDGTWQLAILDLSLVWKDSSQDEAARINSKTVKEFLAYVDKTFQILKARVN